MNLTSKRTDYCEDGIFSDVTRDDTGEKILTTLEHAYPKHIDGPTQQWIPKVPPGVYTCVRGMHQLAHGGPFETFEVTGVDGHTGILFHRGSWNEDSSGCILTGLARASAPNPHEGGDVDDLVTNSVKGFEQFMALQGGVDTFQFTVIA